MTKPRLLPAVILIALLSVCSMSFARFQQEQSGQMEITYPGPGNAVQGLVQIAGSANAGDFQSYRLEFSLQNIASPSWFLITQQSTPVIDGILGEWDTSVLTDGQYMLRLSVYTQNGAVTTLLVEDIRIRNYTPIETETPAPTSENTAPVSTPTILPSETPPPLATPTDLPLNPVSVNIKSLQSAAITGVLIGLTGIMIIIFYVWFRHKS